MNVGGTALRLVCVVGGDPVVDDDASKLTNAPTAKALHDSTETVTTAVAVAVNDREKTIFGWNYLK